MWGKQSLIQHMVLPLIPNLKKKKSSNFPFLNRLERSVIIENGKNIY